jgi:predicted RNase H-like HicB family nuclease
MKKKAGKSKSYTATDGELVLNLESDGGKWLVVTCPFDPELVTQARGIDEAFAMAHDARKLLDECRAGNARKAPRRPFPPGCAGKGNWSRHRQ